MTYIKPIIIICFLSLQGLGIVCTRKSTSPALLSTPPKEVSNETPDTSQTSDNFAYFDPHSDPNFDIDFDAKDSFSKPNYKPNNDEPVYVSNQKPNNNNKYDYESGYESDESDYQPNYKDKPTPLPPSVPTKKDIGFEFEKYIEEIRVKSDKRRGITCHIEGNKMTRIVEKSNDGAWTPEAYVVIGLSIYRAARQLCITHEYQNLDKDKKKEYVAFFEEKAKCFYNTACKALQASDQLDTLRELFKGCNFKHYTKNDFNSKKQEEFWSQIIKETNQAVVEQLKRRIFDNKSLEEINTYLRLAENYAGLDDTHYDITTKIPIADGSTNGTVITLEDKQCGTLTKDQQEDIQNNISTNFLVEDMVEKRLSEYYKSKFLDGKTSIQVRNRPVLRNFYQKKIFLNKMLLAKIGHSGSIASPIEYKEPEKRNADNKITKDNVNQLRQNGNDPLVICLNYNMNVLNMFREEKIVQDELAAIGSDKFMNISINAFPTQINLKEKCNALIKETQELYKAKYPDLCNRLLSTDKNIINEINKIENLQDKRFFTLLHHLQIDAQKPLLIREWNQLNSFLHKNTNPHAMICGIYIACSKFLDQLRPEPKEILFHCKSGKDRTGIIALITDALVIWIYNTNLELDDVIKHLAHSLHYAIITGINAGTPGRDGLKKVSQPEAFSGVHDLLFLKSAELTKIPLINKEIQKIEEDSLEKNAQ